MIMKVIMMMRVRMKVIASSRYGRVLPIVSTK